MHSYSARSSTLTKLLFTPPEQKAPCSCTLDSFRNNLEYLYPILRSRTDWKRFRLFHSSCQLTRVIIPSLSKNGEARNHSAPRSPLALLSLPSLPLPSPAQFLFGHNGCKMSEIGLVCWFLRILRRLPVSGTRRKENKRACGRTRLPAALPEHK